MSLFNVIVASVSVAIVFGILWDHLRLRDRMERDHRRIEAERLYVSGVRDQLQQDREDTERLRRHVDVQMRDLTRRENALQGVGRVDYAN